MLAVGRWPGAVKGRGSDIAFSCGSPYVNFAQLRRWVPAIKHTTSVYVCVNMLNVCPHAAHGSTFARLGYDNNGSELCILQMQFFVQ